MLQIGARYLIRDQYGQKTMTVTVRDHQDKRMLESLQRLYYATFRKISKGVKRCTTTLYAKAS